MARAPRGTRGRGAGRGGRNRRRASQQSDVWGGDDASDAGSVAFAQRQLDRAQTEHDEAAWGNAGEAARVAAARRHLDRVMMRTNQGGSNLLENFAANFTIPEEVNVPRQGGEAVAEDDEVQLSVAGSSRDEMSAIVADVLAAGAFEEASGDIDFGRGNDDASSEEQEFHEAAEDETPASALAGPIERQTTSFSNAASERKSIMENRVKSTSKKSYLGKNITFIIWLYDNKAHDEDIWTEGEYASLALADNLDKFKNLTSRKHLRRAIGKGLESLLPCPINVRKITFELFTTYLICCRKKDGSFLSESSYSGFRSALLDLFTRSNIEIQDEFYSNLKTFHSGLKRKIAENDQKDGRRAQTGKDAMRFDVYLKICELLMADGRPEAAFAHCYLTLSWNLMARSENARKSHLNHIEWNGDSLIIFFTCTKVDQEGLNRNEPWHVYANPVRKAVCPILALAKYLFTFPELLAGDNRLFPGTSQYDRFSSFLGELLKKHEPMFVAMGVSIKDIATHSIRKGAASFCTSGCTISPSFVSVCLRAGWSMGNVKDRYFHFASAGDQFVGRCVSGLPLSSLDFAISPPYFDTGEDEELEIKIQALVNSVCHETCPIGTKYLIRFLLASLYYSLDYLREKLPSDSVLLSNIVICSPDESIVASAVTKHPWNKTDQTPELTGVPEHVTLKCEIAKLTLQHKNLSDEIASRICKELDQRNIGGGLNAAAIRGYLRESHNDIISRLERIDGGSRGDGNVGEDSRQRRQDGAMLHCYSGSFHVLPQDWKVPRCGLLQFFQMWFLGNRNRGIPPLCTLKTSDTAHIKNMKQVRSEWKFLMTRFERQAKARSVWSENWTVQSLRLAHEACVDYFHVAQANGGARRFEQLSWITFAKMIRRKERLVLQSENIVAQAPAIGQSV